ncbi:MAG: transposase [Saprospiraceae bacterium]|nr:transposase [Saprospiraceae bacterium]
MKGELPNPKQGNIFQPNLHQIVNPAHELVLLAQKINWQYFEREFTPLYSNTGKPSKPIRKIGNTNIFIPGPKNKNQSVYEQRKLRAMFRRRASIEPIIGHVKSDHRMERSFYKGLTSDRMNVLLACAAWNLKKFMKKLVKAFSLPFLAILLSLEDSLQRLFYGYRKANLSFFIPLNYK